MQQLKNFDWDNPVASKYDGRRLMRADLQIDIRKYSKIKLQLKINLCKKSNLLH